MRLLLSVCLALLLGCGTALATDKYCKSEADNVVVYVDRTTPYDERDKTALVDGVALVFEGLSGGERFAIRTIAESYTSSERLLEACVPICPEAGLLGDLFSDCTEGMMINDRKKLKSQIVQALQHLLANFVELPNSEILRTLAMSTGEEFGQGRLNRIYMFTDLIENSTYLPGRDFFGTDSPVLIDRLRRDHLIPDWSGSRVSVFGVGRSGKPGRPPLDQAVFEQLTGFWNSYFAATGARVSIRQSLSTAD